MPRRHERKPLGPDDVNGARGSAGSRLPVAEVRQITYVERDGQEAVAEIDPSSYKCDRLAAQLGDQWVQIASGMSRSVVAVHRQALDSYLTFVGKQCGSVPSLDIAPELVVTSLHSWRDQLRSKYDESSIMPYRFASIVQGQLAGAVQDGVVADSVLAAVAQGPVLVAKPSPQPLDEFSKGEVKAMVLAARGHARVIRKIRDWATRTVAAYEADALEDPDVKRLAGLLQSASRLELTTSSPLIAPGLVDLFPDEARTLYSCIEGGISWKEYLVAWCYRAVLPAARDLVPFRVLLMAGTGAAADEISSLAVSDVQWADEGVRMQMTKARAGRSKGRFFRGALPRDGWDVPSVIESLLSFIEPARSHLPVNQKDQLWIAARRRNKGREYRVSPAPFTGPSSLAAWISTVQQVYGTEAISTPHDIRRIRKTSVSQRAIDLGGRLADIAGDDHTTQVFYNSYAHTTSLKVYAAGVVSKFQTTLASAARTGFTAFTQDRSSVPVAAISEALDIASPQARQLRNGALDMGVVDCRDPYDSPFTHKGRLCASAPLSCLLCENAVVFTDHLPNILTLVTSMDRARQTMGPEEWIATWGAQYEAAKALISALPNSVRDGAQQRCEDAVTDLPIWTTKEPR